MTRSMIFLAGAAVAASFAMLVPAQAATVMQQCGQQYQAAKAANTLNGMTWNQFRADCAAKLKAEPTAATAPAATPAAVAPAAPAPAIVAPAAPATATAAAPMAKTPATGGRAAETTRQRQCGAEWRAQKASLIAATPGLTWPKYWSQCNKRLKAAGQ